MKIRNIKQFETSDFYLSAFLLSKGLKLIKVDKSNPQRALFIFEDREDRQKLVEEFLYSRAKVNPKEFVIAIKELKQLLHSSI
jgi:predicted RNA-binding protein YlxR (DUF448 family)